MRVGIRILHTYLPMKMERSVPKRRRMKFSCAGRYKNSSYLPAYENGTECSETSAYKILIKPAYENETECSETSTYKIQTPGNYPEESTQYSEQGESLKSRKPPVIFTVLFLYTFFI